MGRWWFKKENAPEDLRATCERLEAAFKKLEFEWTDMYEKFRLLHLRIAKRAQRAEELEKLHESGEPTAEGGEDAGTASLSPRQSRYQQLILRRRGMITRRP